MFTVRSQSHKYNTVALLVQDRLKIFCIAQKLRIGYWLRRIKRFLSITCCFKVDVLPLNTNNMRALKQNLDNIRIPYLVDRQIISYFKNVDFLLFLEHKLLFYMIQLLYLVASGTFRMWVIKQVLFMFIFHTYHILRHDLIWD